MKQFNLPTIDNQVAQLWDTIEWLKSQWYNSIVIFVWIGGETAIANNAYVLAVYLCYKHGALLKSNLTQGAACRL